jgi:transcription elongation factor GreA
MEAHFITPEGKERLEKELEFLLQVRRLEVAEHIRIAREDGDLSENAGYDAAKEEQAHCEGRILTLEGILKNAQIIQNHGHSSTVVVGSLVTVQEDGYDPETFHIVGSAEVDPVNGRISNRSPLGQALLGKSAGDKVQFSTPNGVAEFALIKVS